MQIDSREKLEMELNELLTTGRLEIAKKIKEARLNGKDLSENTEYYAAVKER